MIKIKQVGKTLIVMVNGKYYGVVNSDEVITYLVNNPDKLIEIVKEMKPAK